MRFLKIIPAAAAPDREGLELAVTRLEGGEADTLLLQVGGGAAILEIRPADGVFGFAYGEARLTSRSAESGRTFADAVGRWLGLEPAGQSEPEPAAPPTEVSWVQLGQGADISGVRWKAYKLSLSCGAHYAEVFFRLAQDEKRGQLVEKWSAYRTELVSILDCTLVGSLRTWRQRRTPERAAEDGRSFGEVDHFEVAVPHDWRVSRQPQGHWRLSDPDDDMVIEMSCQRLPPLPPDAPDVAERVRMLIAGSDHAEAASPVVTFERDDVQIAWSEYAFMSSDTKRPEAAPRPARGRWLLAANRWVQALVTGCWWESDVAVAEQAWNDVVDSLRLSGRVVPPPVGGEGSVDA